MKKLLVFGVAAAVLTGTAAHAQVVDPQTSREIGRAVGEAAVAAQRAAAEATVAARQAMRAARQGFAEGASGASSQAYAPPSPIAGEDAAVDACAMAAEQRGYDDGYRAAVRDIDGVDRRPGGWDVDGVIDARRSWRDRPESWGFRCTVRNGQVVNVDISHDYARR